MSSRSPYFSPHPPLFCPLQSFYFQSDISETLWFFLEFIWGHFWRIFFFKKPHPSLITSTLVSWSFSRKRVSIFCMLLCCYCLRIGFMFYRILHVTKLIPNHYSQWRHNEIITGKTIAFLTKVCRKFAETLCNFLIFLVTGIHYIMVLLWQHHVIMTS